MSSKKSAFRAALPYTIPVFTSFIFLGTAYGILMDSKGFSLLWILFTSTFVYAGSMQFVAVALLAEGFHPLNGLLVTLMVNARHLFYGISTLEKYRGLGKIKPYLIFTLTDETFSLVCSAKPPEDVDRKWFLFFLSALNQVYWILGSCIGGILGGMFEFDTKGIEFVLTALFVVIFLDQWKSTTNHLPAIIGITAAFLCRMIFGAGSFIIPSMIFILIALTILRKPLEGRRS